MIVKDFGAWTAGPGIAHRPEVIFVSHSTHSLGIEANFVDPYVPGFIIAVVNRDPQLVFGQLDDLG